MAGPVTTSMAKQAKSLGQQGGEFLFGEVGMSHRFTVSVDMADYDLGSWSRVSGLSVNWEMCMHRHGESDEIWISPGEPTYQKIRLARAACSDSATVQNWLRTTLQEGKPLTGAVIMLDWTGTALMSWNLKSFFPCGWSVADFDASGSRPLVETLEIAHTGFIEDWDYQK